MITCKNLSHQPGINGPRILNGITAHFPSKGLNAIVGPSGCGKTTLLKVFLGLVESTGVIEFTGSAMPQSIGFVPQFCVAHPNLSVHESLAYAYDLSSLETAKKKAILNRVLELTGLAEHAAKEVSGLSGGQLRRMGLALELVCNPSALICDEVTSGLDPLSEDQILEMLRTLVTEEQKTLLCTIHNLGKLSEFDHITVLYKGHLVYQGTYPDLMAWFEIEDPLRLYHALGAHPLEFWLDKWSQMGPYLPVKEDLAQAPVEAEAPEPDAGIAQRPGFCSQWFTLLRRRYSLLARDTGYLWLLLALTFGFPCIVVIFAIKGLPQIEGLALERSGSFVQQLQGDLRYRMEAAETATLVTGLVMFQVVLLALMGANNGAREIAAERPIYEKERLRGLRPAAYAASKLIFIGSIALLQGVWMALFVKVICRFPGGYFPQLLILAFSCIAMTYICLGISALHRSAERASLLSIYLVGFQLPLSGVVLALPDAVVWLLRPWINAYWSWAGYFGPMKDYQVYDAFRMENANWLPSTHFAATVLGLHMLLGISMVIAGSRRRLWG